MPVQKSAREEGFLAAGGSRDRLEGERLPEQVELSRLLGLGRIRRRRGRDGRRWVWRRPGRRLRSAERLRELVGFVAREVSGKEHGRPLGRRTIRREIDRPGNRPARAAVRHDERVRLAIDRNADRPHRLRRARVVGGDRLVSELETDRGSQRGGVELRIAGRDVDRDDRLAGRRRRGLRGGLRMSDPRPRPREGAKNGGRESEPRKTRNTRRHLQAPEPSYPPAGGLFKRARKGGPVCTQDPSVPARTRRSRPSRPNVNVE